MEVSIEILEINWRLTDLKKNTAADGTRVWDLKTMQELRAPSGSGIRGATSAIAWIKRADDPGEALFVGTQEGYLACWRQGKVSKSYTP